MASNSEMIRDDGIPEHLFCPVCFYLPESEVYQCREGHVLCKDCYFKLKECPTCSDPLDKTRPIRNRHFEGLLDDLEVNCCFKSNGCTQQVPRKTPESHQNKCCYDFEKFGALVNICNFIGYTDCTFQVNNGNAEDAIKHLVSAHDCYLTKSEQFRMNLKDFEQSVKARSWGVHFWTPVIQDLTDKQCYLVTLVQLHKRDNSMTWYTLRLPYLKSNEDNALASTSTVSNAVLHYTVCENSHVGGLRLSFDQEPLSLKRALNSETGSTISRRFQSSFLNTHFTRNGSLLLDCALRNKDVEVIENNEAVENQFTCKKMVAGSSRTIPDSSGAPSWNVDTERLVNTFLAFVWWLWMSCFQGVLELLQSPLFTTLKSSVSSMWKIEKGSAAAKRFLKEQQQSFEENRANVMAFLHKIFENAKDELPPEIQNERDLNYLKKRSLFIAAKHGSVESIQYLIRMNLELNVFDEQGLTPLHFTLYDEEKDIGLEKTKLLVDNGADFKVLNEFSNGSLLHFAAKFGYEKTVEYFISKGLGVNWIDLNGKTPLDYALLNRNEEVGVKIVALLLEHGAECNSESNYHKNK